MNSDDSSPAGRGAQEAEGGARGVPGRTAERGAERPEAILDAAFQCFATYGFRRTTMDDIARAVGLSRPALYLHYRNKEDIFRSLAQRYFETAEAEMARVLDRPTTSVEAQLLEAMQAKDGAFMAAVLATPHGADLMDAGFQISGDIAAAGEARMQALLAGWLARQVLPEGLGSAPDLAGTVMAALKGLKTSCRDLDSYRSGQVRLARLIARALAV
jgi:AcrR family transcriptional regulator